jgi:hypothetical protein
MQLDWEGDREQLGLLERFFLCISDVKNLNQRLSTLLLRELFAKRVAVVSH